MTKIKTAVIFGLLLMGIIAIAVPTNLIFNDAEIKTGNHKGEIIDLKNDDKHPKTATSLVFEWNRTWALNESKNGKDLGYEVAIDSDGNVYVIGDTFFMDDSFQKNFLVKYDRDGNYIWNKTFFGYQYDDIVIDSSDDIYISGRFTPFNVSTIKFNSEGTVLWNETWDDVVSPDHTPTGIAIDNSSEFIYVTGINCTNVGDFFLLKYNANDGNLEDFETFIVDISNGASTFSGDIAVDSLNNIYIVGTNESFDKEDIILLKYNANLNYQWHKIWNNPLGNTEVEWGRSIAIDTKDKIYVTGFVMNETTLDTDVVLIKFNSSGDVLWNKTWDNCGKWDDGEDIAIDSSDNIYITGWETNASDIKNALLLKYDLNGNLKWTKTWGGNNDDYGNGISVRSSNIVITGKTNSYGSNFKPNMFVAKYSESPEPLGGAPAGNGDDGGGSGEEEPTPIFLLIITIALISVGIIVTASIFKQKAMKGKKKSLIGPEAIVQERLCPYCHALIPGDSQTCPYCGVNSDSS